MRHVLFSVGGERCGLPLQSVREVVLPPPRFTHVPRAPSVVAGVMNLRGRVVLVVKLAGLLGTAAPGTPATERVLLLDRGRRDLGLLVTAVEGIEPLDRVGPLAGPVRLGCTGLGVVRNQAVTVLDADGLDAAVLALFDGGAVRV